MGGVLPLARPHEQRWVAVAFSETSTERQVVDDALLEEALMGKQPTPMTLAAAARIAGAAWRDPARPTARSVFAGRAANVAARNAPDDLQSVRKMSVAAQAEYQSNKVLWLPATQGDCHVALRHHAGRPTHQRQASQLLAAGQQFAANW